MGVEAKKLVVPESNYMYSYLAQADESWSRGRVLGEDLLSL